MKTIGKLYGLDVIEDPTIPSGIIYFVNENFLDFRTLVPLPETRWQRIKHIIKDIITAPWYR